MIVFFSAQAHYAQCITKAYRRYARGESRVFVRYGIRFWDALVMRRTVWRHPVTIANLRSKHAETKRVLFYWVTIDLSQKEKTMSKKIDAAVTKVNELVDDLASPSAMTQEEALEFYDSVRSSLETRADGVREDLKRG